MKVAQKRAARPLLFDLMQRDGIHYRLYQTTIITNNQKLVSGGGGVRERERVRGREGERERGRARGRERDRGGRSRVNGERIRYLGDDYY